MHYQVCLCVCVCVRACMCLYWYINTYVYNMYRVMYAVNAHYAVISALGLDWGARAHYAVISALVLGW